MEFLNHAGLEYLIYKISDTIGIVREQCVNTINITHSELVSLRDNANLKPGQQYRITDYVTTTIQENTQSARNQFDIIVTADSTNTLNEEARACLHDGDTYFSNAGAKLEAWKIWYSLDNDTERFAWADAENGKGVIYRMIDEWNNDIPYDFKNIQFKHPNDTTTYPDYYYTFSVVIFGANNIITDLSVSRGYCYDNTMNKRISSFYGSTSSSQIQYLNNNVFIGDSSNICYCNSFGVDCKYNSFGNRCYKNSFGNGCKSNSFGNKCYYNSFENSCESNSFGNNCGNNSFGNNCDNNSLGKNCYYNTFGKNCYYNTFGNDCESNSFGNYCESNSFGNYCESNSFGNYCGNNSFRISADSASSLKDYVRHNHVDDGCSYNVIWNSDTTGTANKLRNINVNRGVSGTNSNYNFINIDTLSANYEIQVAKNSKGEIKIYCEADLIA